MSRNRKYEVYLRDVGRPLTVTGPERDQLLAKIRSFKARGMSYAQMGEQTGLGYRTIANVVADRRKSVKRRTFIPLMRMRFVEPAAHNLVSPVGTVRRLGGFWRDGFPLPWLADQMSYGNRNHFQSVLRGKRGASGIAYGNVAELAELYEKLELSSPADVGIDARASAFASTFAAKKRLAPRSCWDSDTIDDPEAIPEWTGKCGTPFGWLAHGLNEIPTCQPCDQARMPFVLDPGKLRAARERTGLAQLRLAGIADVKVDAYRTWETGRSRTKQYDQLYKIFRVLDIDFEEVHLWPATP